MSLFDDIVKTVEKSETPGLESLTATEIGGISVNGDFDVDEDPMLGMAMEAMGKEVQYDADADPEAAGYSDKDIEKLSEAGAADEDEDDEYSEETIGDLLDGYVEAVYGDPEDEDPTDLLSDDDLDDIDDDLEEGMEGFLPAEEGKVVDRVKSGMSLDASYSKVKSAYNDFKNLKSRGKSLKTSLVALMSIPLNIANLATGVALAEGCKVPIDTYLEVVQGLYSTDVWKDVFVAPDPKSTAVLGAGIAVSAGAKKVADKINAGVKGKLLKTNQTYAKALAKVTKIYENVTTTYKKLKKSSTEDRQEELEVFNKFCVEMGKVITNELKSINSNMKDLLKEAKAAKKNPQDKEAAEKEAAEKEAHDKKQKLLEKTFKDDKFKDDETAGKESLEDIRYLLNDIDDEFYPCFYDTLTAFESYYDSSMESRLTDEAKAYVPDEFDKDRTKSYSKSKYKAAKYRAEIKKEFSEKKIKDGINGTSSDFGISSGDNPWEKDVQQRHKLQYFDKTMRDIKSKISTNKSKLEKAKKELEAYEKEHGTNLQGKVKEQLDYLKAKVGSLEREAAKYEDDYADTEKKREKFVQAMASFTSDSSDESNIPATESVENKKDLKTVKKRIKALEDELETNKKTCDSINANMKKLQKKSKRDVEALKDLVSFTASLGAQMVRQTAINTEIAQLKKEIDDYNNGVAQEKEERREAKRAAQDVDDIARDYAGVTAEYSDMMDDVKDLSEDVIEEVKEEEKAANNGKISDRIKKFIGDFSNAWSEASAKQGPMVAAMASYCLGDDIDMIAEESYIDFVKVYAQSDDAEFESSIEAIDVTLEAFESYLGENADEIEDLYPVYTSLLDMKAAFEAVTEDDKDIQKEIEILEKWIKFYGSQAMKNPSGFLEREIKNLKCRIASLKSKLEAPAAASATV